jgi:hypothetical protein
MQDYPSYDSSGGILAGVSAVFILIWLVFVVFYIYCSWKIFEKAGKPGWGKDGSFCRSYLRMSSAKVLERISALHLVSFS